MLKSPLPRRARRLAGLAVVAAAVTAAGVAAWAAQPGARGLEPDQAQALTRSGQEIECKPDANRELHNCQIVETPWAKVATAADVAREYPAAAKAKGLTADVFLQCGVAGVELTGCKAKKVYAEKPLPAGAEQAFETAAVKVAALYRTKPAAKMPSPMFMTIQFRAKPAMPGGPVTKPLPKTAPDALPMPAPKPRARAASPDVAADARPTIVKPDWIERPSGADFARFYPAAAEAGGWNADVLLTCQVGVDGSLASCAVTRSLVRRGDETPSPEPQEVAMDFGTASLQVAKLFRMTPSSTNGIVRIPIRWLLAPKA